MRSDRLCSLLFLAIVASPFGVTAQPVRPEFVPGEVLLQLAPDAEARLASVLADASLVQQRRLNTRRAIHLLRTTSLSVEAAVAALRRRSDVLYASPNYYRYLDVTPSDPDFDELWALDNQGQTGGTPDADIDAVEAWDLEVGSAETVVAVIDSGTDIAHPDLYPNLWVNPGEDIDLDGQVTAADVNGIDDDGNGYVDDLVGWDFVGQDPNPSDPDPACSGHGTHTAGTIAAVGNNALGVVGVSWNTRIMTLRAFEPLLGILCSASDAALLEAIQYADAMGAPVSSNSWGGGPFNPLLEQAIRGSHSLFVAAAGNGGADGIGDDNDVEPHYPASYALPNVLSVAATDANDELATFSNFGSASVDLGAPGVGILSTLPGGYGVLSGTSMATPHVAGVAALLLAQDPTYTPNELSFRIRTSTDPLAGLSQTTSGGRLNALGALTAPDATTDGVSVEVEVLGDAAIPRGGVLDWSFRIRNHLATPEFVAITFYLQDESGQTRNLIGPLVVQAPAGADITRLRAFDIPLDAPTGSFRLVGQTATSVTFEEDLFVFEILP